HPLSGEVSAYFANSFGLSNNFFGRLFVKRT
ncbi:MAG: hypothetical protein ACI8ZZ_001664, partial [Gammaproteobacteria bacterium]